MRGFDPRTSFGPDVAASYDDRPRGDEAATVALLEQLAHGGSALELAIGTGRIALPLAARGVPVEGIEQSPAMVARLRAKPGGDRVPVTLGDMAGASTGRHHRLVYLVYNTLFNLITQDDQVRCFQNAARHLTGDGVFLVEVLLPSALHPRDGQYVDAERLEADLVTLDAGRYDPVTQLLEECHVELGPAGTRIDPIVQRLAWPGEMDLMARLAGLRLHDRWGGWEREPFDARSTRHVSVYGH
jgi:SAM-dependent methyltransferase